MSETWIIREKVDEVRGAVERVEEGVKEVAEGLETANMIAYLRIAKAYGGDVDALDARIRERLGF